MGHSISVEESHILMEVLPFHPKVVDFLFKFPARSIPLARPLFQKTPNSDRRGVQIRHRQKLRIQQIMETPGLGRRRRDRVLA
jgi:hypothetical protein